MLAEVAGDDSTQLSVSRLDFNSNADWDRIINYLRQDTAINLKFEDNEQRVSNVNIKFILDEVTDPDIKTYFDQYVEETKSVSPLRASLRWILNR